MFGGEIHHAGEDNGNSLEIGRPSLVTGFLRSIYNKNSLFSVTSKPRHSVIELEERLGLLQDHNARLMEEGTFNPLRGEVEDSSDEEKDAESRPLLSTTTNPRRFQPNRPSCAMDPTEQDISNLEERLNLLLSHDNESSSVDSSSPSEADIHDLEMRLARLYQSNYSPLHVCLICGCFSARMIFCDNICYACAFQSHKCTIYQCQAKGHEHVRYPLPIGDVDMEFLNHVVQAKRVCKFVRRTLSRPLGLSPKVDKTYQYQDKLSYWFVYLSMFFLSIAIEGVNYHYFYGAWFWFSLMLLLNIVVVVGVYYFCSVIIRFKYCVPRWVVHLFLTEHTLLVTQPWSDLESCCNVRTNHLSDTRYNSIVDIQYRPVYLKHLINTFGGTSMVRMTPETCVNTLMVDYKDLYEARKDCQREYRLMLGAARYFTVSQNAVQLRTRDFVTDFPVAPSNRFF